MENCFICGGDGKIEGEQGDAEPCSNCSGTGKVDTRLKAKPRKFYLVWRTDGEVPQKRHPRYESALAEAKRLAVKHPGAEFHVVVAISEIVRDDVHVTYLV